MNEIRLTWEPENGTPLATIEQRFHDYMNGKPSGVTLLGNGTLIFSPEGRIDEDDARLAMQEAKFLTDFQVDPLKEGGFLVTFHDSIAVFVGQNEFDVMRSEIFARLSELKFPDEELVSKKSMNQDHLLIGLYARGKLQRDAYNFSFHKRIRGV